MSRFTRPLARIGGGAEHRRACSVFYSRYDSLAFPGGLQRAREQLKQGDPDTIEVAIQFLEEDPDFYRSGYTKEEIIRRLKHAVLTKAQQRRLVQLVVRSVTNGTRRLAQHYARLVPTVPPEALIDRFRNLKDSLDVEGTRRAEHVMKLLLDRQVNRRTVR